MPLCSPMVHQKGCIQTQQVSRLNRCSIEGTCGGLCVQCVQSAGQTHFGMAKNNNRQSHIRKAFLWRFTWGCLPSICTISHDKHASGQPALLYLTSLVPYHTIHTLLASLLFRAICRVGQKRMYKQYLTAYLVFSLPTMPCIHRMYINIFLTDPSYMLYGQDGPTANHQNLIKLKKNIFSARGGRTRAFGCEMRFWQYVSLARSCAF